MNEKPISKVEQAALEIFGIQMAANDFRILKPKDVDDLIKSSFELAYRFFDISKDYSRRY